MTFQKAMRCNGFKATKIVVKEASKSHEILRGQIERILDGISLPVEVKGRVKGIHSAMNKAKKENVSLSEIRDFSGIRINLLSLEKKNFLEFRKIKSLLEKAFPVYTCREYLSDNPGYSGRIHLNIEDSHGIKHEVQIGTKSLEDFIDGPVKGISLHDLIYKGEEYGYSFPEEIRWEYISIMGCISQLNREGKTSSPKMEKRIFLFRKEVESYL